MIFDNSLETNLISPKLVTETLNMAIQPLGKEGQSYSNHFDGKDWDIQGYVDLVWCFQNSRKVYETRFAVTANNDPPLDTVLGRASGLEYGLENYSR